jgi:uncharacterized membrane protein
MNDAIKQYLEDLRMALQGADAALVRDALADAEEHLTNAFEAAAHAAPDSSPPEIWRNIVAEYGQPGEIAAAYRIIERRMKPALAVPQHFYQRSTASSFISAVYDPRAWGALLYMIISMLTGLAYFTWVAVGLYLSIGMLLLVIGLPIAWLFLKSFRGIALVEGRIVEGLLGVRMPRRTIFADQRLKWWEQFKVLLKGKRTWLSVAYMVLMMPLGILYFNIAVVMFALSLKCVATPILQYVFHRPFIEAPGLWIAIPDNLMPLIVIIGLFVFVAMMHVVRWIGQVHGKMARAMLVGK